MANRVYITGAEGFIGGHLSRHLRLCGFDVVASSQDITQDKSFLADLKKVSPTHLVHLASISHPKSCDENPDLAKSVNVGGTAAVLNAAAAVDSLAEFVFASTAQVYGPIGAPEGVLTEESELGPINFYAETKLQGEELVTQFSKETGKKATIFRIFNHVHHTQPAQTFLSSVYRDLGLSESGAKIPVGNLDLYRDMGAVSDLIQALSTVIESQNGNREVCEVFNLCNGRPRLLRDLANELATQMKKECLFVLDETRLRKADPIRVVGSYDKFKQSYGWIPKILTDFDLIQSFLTKEIYVST